MGLYKQAYTDELNGRRVTDSNYMVGTIEDPAFRRSRTGQQWIRRFGKDFDINDPHNALKLIGTKWESIAYPRGVPQELQEQVAQRIGGSRFGRYGNSRTKGAIAINQRADELARQRAEEQERQRQVAANTKQYQQQQQQGDKDAMQKMRDLQMSYNPNDPQWARDYKAAVDNMMMRNPDFDASKDTLYGAAVTTLGLPQTASNSGRALNSLYNGAPQTGTGAPAQPAGMSTGMTLPPTGLALSSLHPSDGVSAMPAKRPQAQQQEQQSVQQQASQPQQPVQQQPQQAVTQPAQQPQQEQPVQQQQQPRQPMLTKVPQYVGDAIASIGDAVQKAPQYIGNKIGEVGAKIDKFPEYIDNKIDKLPEYIGNKIDKLPAYIGNTIGEVGAKIDKFPEYIDNKIDKLPAYIGNKIGEVGAKIEKFPAYIGNKIEKFPAYIGNKIDEVGAKIDKFPEYIGNKIEKFPAYIGNKIGEVGAKIEKFPAYIGNKINSAVDQIQRRFNRTPAPNPVRRKPQTVGANSTMLPGIGPGYRNKPVNQFFNPAKVQNQQRPQGPVIGPGYRNKLVNQFFNPAKVQNQQRPQGPGNSNLVLKR